MSNFTFRKAGFDRNMFAQRDYCKAQIIKKLTDAYKAGNMDRVAFMVKLGNTLGTFWNLCNNANGCPTPAYKEQTVDQVIEGMKKRGMI